MSLLSNFSGAYEPKFFDSFEYFDDVNKYRENYFKKCITCTQEAFKIDKSIPADKITSVLSEIEKSFVKVKSLELTLIDNWFKFNYFYHHHFHYYVGLERCFQSSVDYTLDKATRIFQNHFESLQKYGFDVNANQIIVLPESGKIRTPLGCAIQKTIPSLVGALINIGANVYNNFKDGDGTIFWSNLNILIGDYTAGINDKRTCLDILLKHGCDPNSDKAARGNWLAEIIAVPMVTAARTRDNVSIQMLVDSKADIEILQPANNRLEEESTTPLFAAVAASDFAVSDSKRISTVKLLVDLGANLFGLNSKMQTVVDVAIEKKEVEIADYLKQSKILFRETIFSSLQDKIVVKAVANIVVEYLIYPLKFDLSSKQVGLVKTPSVSQDAVISMELKYETEPDYEIFLV